MYSSGLERLEMRGWNTSCFAKRPLVQVQMRPQKLHIFICMYEYKAKIVKVYDGDTVTAEIDLGFKVSFTEKIRLYGLNTPEVRGDERSDGLISRDRLRERILDKVVTLKTKKDKKGKYGRYIAEIFLGDENINEWLITEGLAERKDY